MGTWFGSQRYRKETGRDPLDPFLHFLKIAWGNPQEERVVGWNLHLRVGRINGR
jgi:hypothetical protein